MQANQNCCCLVQLTNKDHWARLSLALAGPYRGGSLVVCPSNFQYAVEGSDDLSASYQLSNWKSGIASGAFYAFRSLKIEYRQLCLTELSGKLGSADMHAVALGAATAVALLAGKKCPGLDLAEWTVHSEVLEAGIASNNGACQNRSVFAEQPPQKAQP